MLEGALRQRSDVRSLSFQSHSRATLRYLGACYELLHRSPLVSLTNYAAERQC